MSAALVRGDAVRLPLRDESVDLIVTSPPYFALRSYTDGGEHYDGQIGSEETPQAFLEALWTVTEECRRVLKPSGSMFVNLGDKYAGSGGHNNSGISKKATERGPSSYIKSTQLITRDPTSPAHMPPLPTRRTAAPHTSNVPAKSLMGLPWRYANGCVDRLDLILRAEIVWSKPNGLPESVTDRVRRSHEQFFHFTKEPRYFSAADEIREPHLAPVHAPGNAKFAAERNDGDRLSEPWGHPLGKLPGSVWTVATEPLQVPDHLNVDHFAAFPQEWPRRFIKGWCPADGCVLDPFGGTGTTAMVARALGRFGVSLDLSADYLRLARWRVFESGHASKSRERTNREAQVGMFGAAS